MPTPPPERDDSPRRDDASQGPDPVPEPVDAGDAGGWLADVAATLLDALTF